MQPRSWVLLLWGCFVLRGAFYACAIPLWEGFDEYAHFARIDHLARHGTEPARDTPFSPALLASLARVPAHEIGGSYDAFWRGDPPPPLRDVRNYEAQQPPLFYWFCAALMRWFGAGSIALRLVCVSMASAAVPLTFLLARHVLGSAGAAVGATALVALLPLFTYTATHIANDAPSIALGSAVALLAVQGAGMGLGVALGAALLTKGYFLAFLPGVAMMLLWPRTRRNGAIALGVATLIAGWWYAQNWLTTGSLTGNLVLVRPGAASMLTALPSFPLWQCADFAWTTFIWTGNWSFLPVRGWMYRVVGLFALAALAGVAVLVWRTRRQDVLLLVTLAAGFAAAILYFGLASFTAGIGAGSHGWYACCVAVPVAVLAWLGLPRYATGALAVSLCSIELFGLHVYALPYYTGLIAREPGGKLPAYRLGRLADGEFQTMFERLRLEKPEWLGSGVLIGLWVLFLLATFVAAVGALRAPGAAK